jgi:hypothetical protein
MPGIELLRYAALTLICVLLWCSVYGRWSAAEWAVPIEYGLTPEVADVQSAFGAFKAAEDGAFWPVIFHNIPQLGAPYVANWNDYPVTEDFLIWGTGVLAKVIGLFPAANFAVMLLQVLAALAFYYTARRFKCDWKWSFVGALLFGLAPFGFAHSLHHIVITAYWHTALAVLVCFWVSNGRGLRIGARDYWIAVAVAVLTGWQNVYYTSMFIQMMGIGMIVQWVRHGWRAALPGFSLGCVAFAAFMIMNLDTIGYALLHGRNLSAAVRNYGQMELYALKLVDCFIPSPNHKIPIFSALGFHYYSIASLTAEIPPACYFGLAGIAAFLWLAAGTVRDAITLKMRRIPLEAILTLWIFFFATVGGVNSIAGVLGFQMFRSTTRYSIVLLCIALLFAVRRISLIAKRWPSPWPLVAPLLIGIVAVWEILPPAAGENIETVSQAVNSDRTFAQEMEAALPKGGMVFQLPVMDYPESPGALPAYDHFRPYLYTNDLHYSFGSVKGRVQDAWQHVVGAMPPAEQVATLENYGFSAIYINAAGYPGGVQNLLAEYKAAGAGGPIVSPRGDLYCLILKPSPNPVLPPPGPLFANGWLTEIDEPNGQRLHIATGNSADIILTNPGSEPVDKYASFYIASLSPRTVTIEGDGVEQSWRVDQKAPVPLTNLHLVLPPGQSRLTFATDAPPSRQGGGMVTFYIVNFDLGDSPRPEQ